jgi:oligopeptide/dipeptide ABC transporter ATP-binding protein
VLQNIELTLAKREILGLVGESGCGKSTLARLILRIYTPSAGSIHLGGQNIQEIPPKQYFGKVQMLFQDPFSSLNPKLPIGFLLSEMWNLHRHDKATPAKIGALLDEVGLPKDAQYKYAHEFSGGQRQRITIARALAAEPSLLVADEPVSALDVSIQAQILNLLQTLRNERGLAMLFISHDLAVVNQLCDRILVLYRGHLVEELPQQQLHEARHPYTQLLLRSLPSISRREAGLQVALNQESEAKSGGGCPFLERCPQRQERCAQRLPEWTHVQARHRVACFAVEAT